MIYSSFHHCFRSERCYFSTFGEGVVACRAIMGGICKELWSNTTTRNYCKHYSQWSSHHDVKITGAHWPKHRFERGNEKYCCFPCFLEYLVYVHPHPALTPTFPKTWRDIWHLWVTFGWSESGCQSQASQGRPTPSRTVWSVKHTKWDRNNKDLHIWNSL